MFELDLLVQMKILVPDELNERLEMGEPNAYLELEDHLFTALATGTKDWPVTKLLVRDAGPYNDAGQWEASIFHE